MGLVIRCSKIKISALISSIFDLLFIIIFVMGQAKSSLPLSSSNDFSLFSPPGLVVRNSVIHGRGVFATQNIASGVAIVEYTGERITWAKALKRHPWDETQPHHTFFFHINDRLVIDAAYAGNASRWINHSCTPNCEAEVTPDKRVIIKSLRSIQAGEELSYDYGLIIDARYTKKLKQEYACYCRTSSCRGTMLAPK